jgi:hypothetical protein
MIIVLVPYVLALLGGMVVIKTLSMDVFFELINAMVLAAAIAAGFGFSFHAVRVLNKPMRDMDGGDVLLLGMWTIKLGLILVFFTLWAYRLTNDFSWINSHTGSFGRWMIATGLTMLLASSGAVDGRIPPKALLVTGAVVGFAVLVALLLVGIGYA